MDSILSVDIDLGRVHAFSNVAKIVCENAADLPFEAISDHQIILIEVASPIFYGSRPGEILNRTKWAIFNSMMAGRIYERCPPNKQVLVAPSSKWTESYPEDVRQAMAGVNKEYGHDIRECQAMQFFFATNPGNWMPFEAYFAGLSTKKGKKKDGTR